MGWLVGWGVIHRGVVPRVVVDGIRLQATNHVRCGDSTVEPRCVTLALLSTACNLYDALTHVALPTVGSLFAWLAGRPWLDV
jgi:hypothetical protein